MGKLWAIVALLLAVVYFFASRDGYDPDIVKGKRVLVTGSSSGIGKEIAFEYAQLGARIVLTARRAELLEKVAQQCRSLGAREVHVVSADMSNPADRTRVVKATERALGGLDHLILNHALLADGIPWKASPENITTLNTMMSVNFVSFVDLASQFLPSLRKSSGNIGVVSSIAGKMAIVRGESYAASKFALHGFFTSWRQELIHQGADVSITMCVLGPIITEAVVEMLKKINPDQSFVIGGVPAKDTAVAILRAVATRAREMYYGRAACIATALHKLFPNFIEDKLADYFMTFWEARPQ